MFEDDAIIHRLEAHETDEWIRKDGKLLNDPHGRHHG